jgi:hypothetical protein
MMYLYCLCSCLDVDIDILLDRDHLNGRGVVVDGFTSTYAISAYQQL